MESNESQAALRVMLIDDDPKRARWVQNSLREFGFDTCSIVAEPARMLKEISEHAPDVIIIDMESPGRDLLESLSVLAAHQPTPVVMFSEEEDPDYISRAVAAGVSTYLVGGIEPAKVRPIIEVALAQFRNFQGLRQALDDTRSELSARRTIDQAKLRVMQALNIDEQQAYEHMRKEAMNAGVRLATLARQIMETSTN
ncbi:MAG: response regulator [Pseudomonadota bacterium]